MQARQSALLRQLRDLLRLQEQDLEAQQWERLQARWGQEPFFVERILQIQEILEARRRDLGSTASPRGEAGLEDEISALRAETAALYRRLARRLEQERLRVGRELSQMRLPPRTRRRGFREIRPSQVDIRG